MDRNRIKQLAELAHSEMEILEERIKASEKPSMNDVKLFFYYKGRYNLAKAILQGEI